MSGRIRVAVVLHFKVKIVTINTVIPINQFAGAFHVVFLEGARDLGRGATTQADDAFIVFFHQFVVNAGLVVFAGDFGFGNHATEIFVAFVIFGQESDVMTAFIVSGVAIGALSRSYVSLYTEDGFDAVLLGGLVEVDQTRHGAVVGDGDSFHATIFDIANQLVNLGEAV